MQDLEELKKDVSRGIKLTQEASIELIERCQKAEKEQVVDVKQLIADYDNCHDDGSFEPPHPIFLMAQHIDNLKKELAENKLTQDQKCILDLFLYENSKGWGEVSSGLTSDFNTNTNSFYVRYKDGSEYRIEFKISEV